MRLKDIHNVYFIGIGGIGMSALARYFKVQGMSVSGYDKTPSSLTDELNSENIEVHFEDNISLIPEAFKKEKQKTLIVYTPAIPKEHKELNYLKAEGFDIKKRADVLGIIAEHHYTIAVAGTHGKTTTSSMITHVLKSAGIDCTAFLGGITQNYNTNFILGSGASQSTLVVEADEYDRSFLTLHPDIAVITSVDPDHLDIYGDEKSMIESYSLFAGQVKSTGELIVSEKAVKTLQAKNSHISTYSLHQNKGYYAADITVVNGQYQYDVVGPQGKISGIRLGLPGIHNVENSVASVAVAKRMGIEDEVIKQALESFKGVKRRFEYQIKTKELVFIDDYAHHPEELRACISSVKQMYPGKKVTGIFQPHLFSRTRDFAEGFARSLDLLDNIILLEIYPARELPIEGINSQMLLDKISNSNKILSSKESLIASIEKYQPEIILTLGAGDIDRLVEPIKKYFTNKEVSKEANK